MAAQPLTLQQCQFSELNDAFVTLLWEIITDNNQYSDKDSDTSEDNISLSSASTPSSSDDSQLVSHDPPSCQNAGILLDNRRGIDLRSNNSFGNSNGKTRNGTSMSSRQMGTWPQLIGCALFKIWSLISDSELKSRRGYSF